MDPGLWIWDRVIYTELNYKRHTFVFAPIFQRSYMYKKNWSWNVKHSYLQYKAFVPQKQFLLSVWASAVSLSATFESFYAAAPL